MYCISESGRKLGTSTSFHNRLLPNGHPFLPFGDTYKKFFGRFVFPICLKTHLKGRFGFPNGSDRLVVSGPR
jgi:hypothetical protein